MSHQENDKPLPKASLKLFTQSKSIPTETKIIENKNSNPAIGVTCQRYYKSKTSKIKGSRIPLSVMNKDTHALEPKKSFNETIIDTILETEKKKQKHNWNDDPLGLCLTEEQQESKVKDKDEEKEKETEEKAKKEEANDKEREKETEIEAEAEARIEENKEKQPGSLESKINSNIEDEITVIYTDGVIVEKDDNSSTEEHPISGCSLEPLEDLSEIDNVVSPISSPPLKPTKLNISTTLENQESLSHHLYAHYQDYFDTGNSEVKEGGKEEDEKEEVELVLEDFSSGSSRPFNEISIDSCDVTWDAIFHPMSTFQHIHDELEYHNWNPEDEPVTADIVAERLIHAKLHPLESNNSSYYPSFAEPVQGEAAIPIMASTPISKPSPVLTIELDASTTAGDIEEINTLANKNNDPMAQEDFLDQDKQKHYFHILQNIRGPSHSTIVSFQLAGNTAKKCIKNTPKKENSFRKKKKEEEGRGVLPAIFGKRCIRETEKFDNISLDENEEDDDDEGGEEDDIEKDIDAIIAEKQRYWNERRLFWFGFLCPLLWLYGSIHIKSSRRLRSSVNKRWQKRCRLASLYFSVVTSVVALVVVVKMAGNAAIRQTQSDEIRAVIAV